MNLEQNYIIERFEIIAFYLKDKKYENVKYQLDNLFCELVDNKEYLKYRKQKDWLGEISPFFDTDWK